MSMNATQPIWANVSCIEDWNSGKAEGTAVCIASLSRWAKLTPSSIQTAGMRVAVMAAD
nr:hypothetical protein [Paenibacillus glycinis]